MTILRILFKPLLPFHWLLRLLPNFQLATSLFCFISLSTLSTNTFATKTVTVAEGIATAKVDQGTAVPGIEALPTWPYTEEFKAILGGVLGFWGGVGTMGTLFLVILLAQKYCCRSREDKDDSG